MSFPYELDLMYGSEKSTADPIGRLSFGKPIIVGNKVIFRSALYDVSNDYTMIYDEEYNEWYPDFNEETIKRAYSQVEFNKSDLESVGDIGYIYGLYRNYLEQESPEQPSNQPFSSFFVFEIPKDNDSYGLVIMSNETDYDNPDEDTPSSLVTLSVNVIIGQYDDNDDIIYTKSIPCTVRTFIGGVENSDSSYIPVFYDNYPVPVEKVIEFNATHKTAIFPVLIPDGKGYDRGENAYFEVGVEADNSDAKDKILNWSKFSLVNDGGVGVILTTQIQDVWSRDYNCYSAHIPVCNYSDGYIETSTFTGNLKIEEYNSDNQTYNYTNIGTVNLKLVSAETGADMSNVCLLETTSGTCLIKL